MAARDSNQLNIRVEEEIKKEFIQKAKADGTSATELLVTYMKRYLGKQPKSNEEELLPKLEEMLEERFASFEKDMIARFQITLGE
ncbi:MAG: hypothetical protein ACYT04_59400 [Nostoc sp.]